MKRINYLGKIIMLAFLSVLIACSFPSSAHQSWASSNSADGFIIEAEEITGTLGIPLIVLGDTASRKAVPMIDLAMDNVEVKGLVIKKVTQTANGPITTVIKSNGTAKLKNMRVQITNLELGGIFIPKLGYLGMKKVKLLAYKQTADVADLPSFSFSFDTSSGSQMEDKTEDGLKEIIENLQEATAGEEEVNDESEDQDKEEEESDKPSEEPPVTDPEQPETETPVTEPEQPEAETPATEPEPSVPTPTKPEEEDENPDGDQGEPDSPPVEDDPGETDPEPPTIPPTS